jgi:hypothetical protein
MTTTVVGSVKVRVTPATRSWLRALVMTGLGHPRFLPQQLTFVRGVLVVDPSGAPGRAQRATALGHRTQATARSIRDRPRSHPAHWLLACDYASVQQADGRATARLMRTVPTHGCMKFAVVDRGQRQLETSESSHAILVEEAHDGPQPTLRSGHYTLKRDEPRAVIRRRRNRRSRESMRYPSVRP